MKTIRLLIVSSSKRQALEPAAPIPALERYHGITIGGIRRLKETGKLPKDLEILIVSAEFGLIGPDERIPRVDHVMTEEEAEELQKDFLEELEAKFNRAKYSEIFVNLGFTYAKSIKGFAKFADARVIYAKGTLGKKAEQMKQWILRSR